MAAVRVVRIIARLNVGGPARHVTILNRGLDARGYATLLVYGQPGGDEGSLEDLTAGLTTVPIPDLGRRIHLTSDLRAFARILRLLFQTRPHVIHTHTAKAGALGRVAGWIYNRTRRRRERALVFHTFHGHVLEGYFGSAGTALIRSAERLLSRMSDRIIAISDRQHRDLVERFRICTEAQLATIPLGLELDDLLTLVRGSASLREELGIPSQARVVGYVGRLVAIKDLPLLLRAFARLEAFEDAPHLIIAGDGPLRAELGQLAGELGVASRVHFVGWRRDLRQLYASFDCVGLTSLNEGTPVAIIEAMAAAIPVVATAVGGVPDVVREGVSGILVRSREPEAVAAALTSLLRDSDLRRKLGEEARAFARERFTSRRLVNDIDQLYQRSRTDLTPIDRSRA